MPQLMFRMNVTARDRDGMWYRGTCLVCLGFSKVSVTTNTKNLKAGVALTERRRSHVRSKAILGYKTTTFTSSLFLFTERASSGHYTTLLYMYLTLPYIEAPTAQLND